MATVGVVRGAPRPATDDRVAQLDALYQLESAGMVRLAYTLLANNAEAEEIVQDSFVEVHRRWHDIRKPGAYLRSAVMSRCRSALQRRKMRPPHAVEEQKVSASAGRTVGRAHSPCPTSSAWRSCCATTAATRRRTSPRCLRCLPQPCAPTSGGGWRHSRRSWRHESAHGPCRTRPGRGRCRRTPFAIGLGVDSARLGDDAEPEVEFLLAAAPTGRGAPPGWRPPPRRRRGRRGDRRSPDWRRPLDPHRRPEPGDDLRLAEKRVLRRVPEERGGHDHTSQGSWDPGSEQDGDGV